MKRMPFKKGIARTDSERVSSMKKTRDYEQAIVASSYHQLKIENDSVCGCFYCLTIFSPKEIVEWVDDSINGTAICPYCEIDAIIGESSGYPITKEFLQQMHECWFSSHSEKGG